MSLEDRVVEEAANLKDAIGYQSDAIVSRMLVDKDAGTVTLFAFDMGQGLSEHTAPYDAMVFILDGEAEVRIAGRSLRIKEGEFTIMPANKLQS
ncbi:MAG: cupin domain-containing protein [Candidatus Methanomethylicaceae archaeon]